MHPADRRRRCPTDDLGAPSPTVMPVSARIGELVPALPERLAP